MTLRLLPTTTLLVALFSLAAAAIAQFGFGLQPCVLCLYQRLPYGLITATSLIALLPVVAPLRKVALMYLVALIFLGGGLLALYHVGVEHHLFGEPTSCGFGPWWLGGGTPDIDVANIVQAMSVQPVRCDTPAWTFLGLSMAGYNAIWSLSLAVYGGKTAQRWHRTLLEAHRK